MKKSLLAIVLALSVFLAACEEGAKSKDFQDEEQRITEEQQGAHLVSVPAPKLTDSQERRNLRERLLRFNTPSKVSYIYLLNEVGNIVSFMPIKGKVSSVNSMLTTPVQISWACRTNHGCSPVPVDSPDLDGSYGSNGDAIFFFTTEGVYVEWNGKYLLADQPLQIEVPELVLRYDKNDMETQEFVSDSEITPVDEPTEGETATP